MKTKLSTALFLFATALLLPVWANAQSVAVLAAGSSHFCTLDDAGIVSCTTVPSAARLAEPEGLPALIDIAAGERHTCGITFEGGAVCWGDNFFNQLDVPELSAPLVSLAAGFNHTCAVDTEGEAICWGLNTNLQLEPPPTEGGFSQVDAARNYSCGIAANGDLVCWSTDGEISTNSVTPGPFIEIDSAINDRCGLDVNGDISCARFLSTPDNGPYVDLAVGPGAVCGLTQDGVLDCTINFLAAGIAAEIEEVSANVRFTAIESGHAPDQTFNQAPICGIREDDGSVLCFGGNSLPTSADTVSTASVSVAEISLGLSALAYDTNAVELFWNRQPTRFPPVLIEIFRDGELLTTTDAMFSFFDIDNVGESQSTYAIRAVDEAGNTGPFSNEVTVSREVGGSGESSTDFDLVNPRIENNVRIENLRLMAPGFFAGNSNGTIILTWDLLNESDLTVAGYEIRQNNTTLAFTRSNVYTNNSINNSFCGTFSVLAIGEDGQILESTSTPLIFENRRTC